jgi:hypothetical protein
MYTYKTFTTHNLIDNAQDEGERLLQLEVFEVYWYSRWLLQRDFSPHQSWRYTYFCMNNLS